MKNMKSSVILAVAIVFILAFSRLIPHWPNFTPIGAMALFGGCYLGKRYSALIVIAAMLVSDLIIGFHGTMIFVYAALLLYILIGMGLKKRKSVVTVTGAALAGSITFFLITNFGVWFSFSFYPNTLMGLLTSYVAAIPFFHYTLLADLSYAGIVFGLYELLQRNLFVKKSPAPVVTSK